jgi:superfamily II DNA helicase RecQ
MTAYRRRSASDRETLERMVFYAQTGQCRWHVLLEHLEGERALRALRHCDNCLRIAAHDMFMTGKWCADGGPVVVAAFGTQSLS